MGGVSRPNPVRVLSDLGRRVHELRVSARLTQEQLAERLGWLPRQVQRVEAGDANLSVSALTELAASFGVTVRQLFDAPASRARPGPGRPSKNRIKK